MNTDDLAANQAMALGALIHEVAGGILEKGMQPK